MEKSASGDRHPHLQFLMSEMKTVRPRIASPNFAMIDPPCGLGERERERVRKRERRKRNGWREREREREKERERERKRRNIRIHVHVNRNKQKKSGICHIHVCVLRAFKTPYK